MKGKKRWSVEVTRRPESESPKCFFPAQQEHATELRIGRRKSTTGGNSAQQKKRRASLISRILSRLEATQLKVGEKGSYGTQKKYRPEGESLPALGIEGSSGVGDIRGKGPIKEQEVMDPRKKKGVSRKEKVFSSRFIKSIRETDRTCKLQKKKNWSTAYPQR